MLNVEEIQNERFVWSIWDGSPVNGCARVEMEALGMKFPEGGSSFLIRDKRAGRFVHFQTFDPELSGYEPMTYERARELAEETRTEMVTSAVRRARQALA